MPFGQPLRLQAIPDQLIDQGAVVHAVRDEHEPLVLDVLGHCECPVFTVPRVGCGRGELVAADGLVGVRCLVCDEDERLLSGAR